MTSALLVKFTTFDKNIFNLKSIFVFNLLIQLALLSPVKMSSNRDRHSHTVLMYSV